MHNKILIVDDDWGVCNSLAMLLRGEGYCVDATSDCKEAITLIRNGGYNTCLFDYKLKGLNGIELVRMTNTFNPQCSVFIVSAMFNLEELCKKEIKEGLIAGIFHKPFEVEDLLKEISAVMMS